MTRHWRDSSWQCPVVAAPAALGLLLIFVGLMVGFVPASALAQVADDGPIVIGQRRQLETLHIEKPSTWLELNAIYSQDRSNNGGVDERFHETFFSELLGMDTTGYIFAPSFIDLKLKGEFGLTQSFSDSDGNASNETGELYRWDARATYRKEGDSPFGIFTQREQDWINREFGATLESTTTTTGADLGLRTGSALTRLQVMHIDSTQTGLNNIAEFGYSRDLFTWNTVARPNPRNTINWNYSFSHVEQSGSFDSSSDTHDASLSHELLFGPSKRSSLSSSVDFRRQAGDTDFQTFRWDERLRLYHTDHFETHYEYRFYYYDFPQSDRLRHFGQVGFIHRLYQSLVTSGNVSASNISESQSDFSSTELAADLNLDYRKRVPGGTFYSTLSLRASRQDNSARGSTSNVIDQNGTFADPSPIIISGTNVSPTGIVITDPSGLTIYQPGLDYTVTKFADRLEINRVIGGMIGNLSPVLIDYLLLPQAGSIADTRFWLMSGRYEITRSFLKGLSLYASYSRQDQSVETDDPGAFVPNTFDDYLAGIDYTIGALTFGAEGQRHESEVVPLDAQRYSVKYVRRFNDLSMALYGNYTILDYRQTDNHIELFTISGQARYQVSPRLFLIGTVLWRNQSDILGGNTRGFEQQLEAQWNYRQTSLYAQLRNSTLRTEGENTEFQFFRVGIRREF